MNQKVILTLWRAELFNKSEYEPSQNLVCNLRYCGETFQSRKSPICDLLWKQTFVFRSDGKSPKVQLEFISAREKEHEEETPTINNKYLGKSIFPIKYNPQEKTLSPKTADIIDQSGRIVGKVELSYQIYQAEEKYKLENIEYKYFIVLSEVELMFKRVLSEKTFMYLKAYYGDQYKQELIPFEPIEGQSFKYRYSYPIRYFLNEEENINFQIVTEKTKSISNIFQLLGKPNQYSQMSQKGKPQKKTLNINSSIVYTIMGLNFAQNRESYQKLTILIPPFIDVGVLKFKLSVVFKESINELELLTEKPKSTRKDVKLSKNGTLTLLSLAVIFEDLTFRNKSIQLQIKLGHQTTSRNVDLETNQISLNEIIRFKRVWEQTMEFVVFDTEDNTSMKWVCSASINLRQMFQLRSQLKKSIKLFGANDQEIGQVRVDLDYVEDEFFSKRLRNRDDDFDTTDRRVRRIKSKLERQVNRSFSRRGSKKGSSKYSREGSTDSPKSNEFPPIALNGGASEYSLMLASKINQGPTSKRSISKRVQQYSGLNLEEMSERNQDSTATYRQRIQIIKNRAKLHLPSVYSRLG